MFKQYQVLFLTRLCQRADSRARNVTINVSRTMAEIEVSTSSTKSEVRNDTFELAREQHPANTTPLAAETSRPWPFISLAVHLNRPFSLIRLASCRPSSSIATLKARSERHPRCLGGGSADALYDLSVYESGPLRQYTYSGRLFLVIALLTEPTLRLCIL